METLVIARLDGRLRWNGDKLGADELPCPLCRQAKLGIDYAPHQIPPHEYIVKVFCRECSPKIGSRAYLARLAESVGMTVAEVVNGNDHLPSKYRRPGRQPMPSPEDIARWQETLASDPERLAYVTKMRGVSMDVVRQFRIGHDGERFTLPVFDGDSIVNLRRYLIDGDPKITSLAGSGAQLYTPVPSDGWVVICEGEWDALRGLSLGIPTVTNTGGAATWRDEWTERIGDRHVFIVYDQDRGGRLGEARVAESFKRIGLHRSLTVVHLPMRFTLKQGADLSDYLAKYSLARFKGELRRAYAQQQDAEGPDRSRDSHRAHPISAARLRQGVSS